jgi:hypothetical protein
MAEVEEEDCNRALRGVDMLHVVDLRGLARAAARTMRKGAFEAMMCDFVDAEDANGFEKAVLAVCGAEETGVSINCKFSDRPLLRVLSKYWNPLQV